MTGGRDKDEDDQDWKSFRIARGDRITIAVAALCTLIFLWLMFGPSPFELLFDHPKAPVRSGEVTVTIPQKP